MTSHPLLQVTHFSVTSYFYFHLAPDLILLHSDYGLHDIHEGFDFVVLDLANESEDFREIELRKNKS